LRAARIAATALALAVAVPATADAAVRPAAPKPPPARTHVVRPGDNLETLAKRFGTSVKALAAANKIRNFNLVVIGAKLNIPAPSAVTTAKAPRRPD
jgi:putative chitinase